MTKRTDNLKRAWFGLHPRETEQYLRKLEAMQNADAERLEELIRAERDARDRMSGEAERLRALLREQEAKTEPGLARLVRERLALSVGAVRRLGEEEREILLRRLEAKRGERSKAFAETDKQLELTRSAFEDLLAAASRLVDYLREPAERTASASLGEQELHPAFASPSARAEVAATREAPAGGEPEAMRNRRPEDRSDPGANVVPFRLPAFPSKPRAAERPEQEQVTADGAAAPAVRWAASHPQAGVSAPASDPSYAQAAASPPADVAPPSGFWGDLRDYMHWESADPSGASPEAVMPAEPVPAPAEEAAFVSPPASAAAETAGPSVPPAASVPLPASPASGAAGPSRAAADHPPAAAGPAEPSSAESPAGAANPASAASPAGVANPASAANPAGAEAASPALAEEIRAVQRRYIVGKAAGETLHADDGTLLIAKGAIITAETIEAAWRAGKMADLIMQMVLPTFREETD